ncbi:uncharacterized protein LOC110173339 [Boleophthalmus pectinirostris]|uniref:uncharacterized protein LOC110173339 n=1 Tax=Boleophthalmus pectinirostris TaxID=150288 RepID=UPI000A1C61D2|nr:uncharacterized protein LOC110173339 [Boleophthalmus pectinirostris]
MKIIPDSTSFVVVLLLLELIGQSLSRPAHNPTFCTLIGSMLPHVEKLISLSEKLHELSDEDLSHLATADHRLDSLLEIQHTAAAFTSIKINESLSQLHNYSESYRFHMEWLKAARENVSLPTQPTEGASRHLQQLTHLLNSSLSQVQDEVVQVPSSSPPSLPLVSSAFDALRFSVEVSEKLRAFSFWTKRWIRFILKHSRCPRR